MVTDHGVAGGRLENLRAAGQAVVGGLTRVDQAAVVTYQSAVSLGSGLTSDLTAVRKALERAVPDGETSLVDGTYAAMIVGESDAGRALIISFSDGLDTSSWLSSDAVLDTARRSDVVVYGVSASRTKPEFLHEIAALTGGRVFDVEKTANLPAVFAGILRNSGIAT